MYLDISSNQGAIDWHTVAKNKDIRGLILRSTTQNNKLDVRTIENYNAVLQTMPELAEISVYKFSYAKDYISARLECHKCIKALAEKGVHYDYLYLDLEKHSGADYTTREANECIYGYMDEMHAYGIENKLRLYFNYNYLKNIIDRAWFVMPIWLARYNSQMGDIFGAKVVLWQYTSTGRIDGIMGNVDISDEIITSEGALL